MTSRAKGIAIALAAALVLALVAWRLAIRAGGAPAAPISSAPSADAGAPARRVSAPRPKSVRLPTAKTSRDDAVVHGRLEGRVVSSATAEGVAGASVTLARADETLSVRAGEDGRFRFDPPALGTYAVALVTADGYLPLSPPWGSSPLVFVARAGERVDSVVLYLTPALEYVATVRDAAAAPVAGARVRVLGDDGPEATATCDVRGEARFAAADGALVEARHPDHAVGRARIDLGAQASRRISIKLGPKPTSVLDGSIAGHVHDPDGAPLRGAIVRATAQRGPGPGAALDLLPTLTEETDDAGGFAFDRLDRELYDVVATHAAYAPTGADGVKTGTLDLALVMKGGGRIRGRVTDASSSTPVVAFTVVVAQRIGPLEEEPATLASTFDAQGRYETAPLGPGSYRVTAVAEGFAPSAPIDVTIPDPSADVDGKDFALGRGGRVSGTVIDEPSRRPIQAARVSLEGRLGPASAPVPLLASTTTDAAGRFELAGLSAGLRSISVAAAGHHGRVVSGLVVGEGGNVGPIEVALTPTKPGEEPRTELTGIGAALSAKDDALIIGSVLPGGGAAEAGLAPGDAIVAVGGAAVVDVGFEAAIQRIRGPEGSTVLLIVRKQGATPATEVVVTRKRIRT